jgi:hypothetical protein
MTIVRAAESSIDEMLANSWQETECCLDVCHAINGAHIKIYFVRFSA